MAPSGVKLVDELITIRDLLRWTLSEFNSHELYYGHGTDNSWDEAVNIVLRSLYLPFDIDKQMLDARLTFVERQKIIQIVQKRINERIPAAYLLNEAWFAGLPFYIDERVLIPRSAIAELIDNEFQPWIGNTQIKNILELGTGSGCIAIACAKAFPDAEIVAVELDQKALEVAQINIEKHNLADQITLLSGDLFKPVPKRKYNIIVSNPPYVSADEWKTLPKEYHHEPEQAFLGKGKDGLRIVEDILQQHKKYLAKNGILVVEVGNNLESLLDKHPEMPFILPEFEHGDGGVFILQ